jgi:hypothetical protein
MALLDGINDFFRERCYTIEFKPIGVENKNSPSKMFTIFTDTCPLVLLAQNLIH